MRIAVVGVADVSVAGDVPAVPHVAPLPRVGQITASGGPDHRQRARRPVRDRLAVRTDHPRGVARHRETRRAGTDVVTRGGDEDVQHLGAADAVDDSHPGGIAEVMPYRLR
jgi:hypothetical protein